MLNPPPDPTAWGEVTEPERRLRLALAELYAWYGRNERMLENITRDLPLVPAMRGAVEEFGRFYGAAAEALLRGRRERGARRRRVAAAIGHALAFDTWRSLVRDQDLSADEAVELIADLVDCASRA